MKRKTTLSFLLVLCANFGYSQSDTIVVTEVTTVEEITEEPLLSGSWVSTRIINGHSPTTLAKGELQFIIQHRFGDMAGGAGGVQQWFGLDNATDIRLAFEYGLTDNWMIGLGRSRGTGRPYHALVDGFTKYRFLNEAKGAPFSMAVMGLTTWTYAKSSPDATALQYYGTFADRLAYCAQVNLAKQITKRFTVALNPTFVYRNYVAYNDVNALFALGGALKYGITKQMGIVAEYYQTLDPKGTRQNNYPSLGIGFEWVTFGHTFTVNVTNSKGFTETQFIPYTFENWSRGQFRLGFSITRSFSW